MERQSPGVRDLKVWTGEDVLPEGRHEIGPRLAVPLAVQQQPRGADNAGLRRSVDHQAIMAEQLDPVRGVESHGIGDRVVDRRVDRDGAA